MLTAVKANDQQISVYLGVAYIRVFKALKVPTLIFVAKFRELYFVSSSRRATILHIDTETQYSPRAVDNLRADLNKTPESGHDALVVARLHEIHGNRSNRTADLLRSIVLNEIVGIRASTVAGLAAAVHPEALLRCITHLPRDARSHQIRNICGTIRWREALPLVALVRDEHKTLGGSKRLEEKERSLGVSFGNAFADGVLTLGLLCAIDTCLPYAHGAGDLHRSSGAETLFLFGAARDPQELLRELNRVHILTWLQQNYDTHLAIWALSNPSLLGEPRFYAIMQNAPQVVANLRHSGILGLGEVVAWLRGGSERDALERSIAALSLPDDVAGAKALKRTTLFSCKDLSEVVPHLSKQSRKSTSCSLSDDPWVAEIIESLLPEWHSTGQALIDAAQALHGRNPSSTWNS